MQPLATRGLAERLEPELFQTRLQFLRGFDDRVERNVRIRIEIENETAGNRRMAGLIVPRVILNSRDLRCCNQTFDTVDLRIGLAISFDVHQADQVRHAAHGMPLKESLCIDAVWRADEGARPALEMLDHPGTDLV